MPVPLPMPAAPDRRDPDAVAAQRRRAVRTALWLAAVALAIYIAFILSGVLAS